MHRWDFVETVRRVIIRALGLTGYVTDHQYVGTLDADPEAFEEVLHAHGIRRNALAYFKHDPDGDWSAGSWVYLPDGFFGHFQEHLTIFPDGELYVHEEYNWRRHPIAHLRETHFKYPTVVWRARLHDWGAGFTLPDDHPDACPECSA